MTIVKISMAVAAVMAGLVFITNLFQSVGVAFVRSGFAFCGTGLWTVVMLAAARSLAASRRDPAGILPDMPDGAAKMPQAPADGARRAKDRTAETLLR